MGFGPSTAAVALLFLSAGAAFPEQPAADPAGLYQRVRQRVMDDISRLPNFTCVETVTRRIYASPANRQAPSCEKIVRGHEAENPKRPLVSLDRLRLDVAIADKQEVFSWVGAARFESSDLRQLVGGGQAIIGDFGSMLLAIFAQHPTMHFEGERKIGGQRLFEYSYQTPVDVSQYYLRVGTQQITTAYEGSVFLDPVADDVVRVTVQSAVLPESTGYCQVAKQLDYARQRIGATDALIPHEATSWALDREGVDMSNNGAYSGCREYLGESVLNFDVPDKVQPEGPAAPSNVVSPPLTIPPGLRFDCRIVTAIDSKTAAAGDRIQGVLRSPIIDTKGNVLAPLGTRVAGRLMGFVERPGGPHEKPSIQIEVQLRSLELGGTQVPFAADMVESAGAWLRLADRPHVGTFVFHAKSVHVTNLDAKWITAAASPLEPRGR
jgi:hypothetical protein